MDNKAGQKSDVQEKINQNISLSEEKRKILRFEHNLAALIHGSIQVLANDEFVTGLAVYLPEKYLENKGENRKVLVSLSRAVVSPESRLRERTLTVLALTAARLIEQEEKGGILILVHSFCKWLEYETEILPGLPVILKRIEELTAWLIEKSFWKEARRSIALLAVIQTGQLQKGAAIRSLAGKTLGSLATDAVIEKLIERYLVEENDQALCKEILLCLGNNATMYLLNKAIRTFERDESLVLIGLLPDLGPQARPVFEKYLGQNPTWATLRNIIFIVSEIQDESFYHLVEQYFSHKDRRVQH